MYSIKDLPCELLVVIFDNLDLKSKLKAQVVCKRWQQLIDVTFASKTILLIEDIQNWPCKKYGDFKPYKIKTNNKRIFSVITLTDIISDLRKSNYKNVLSKIISKYNNLKTLYICLLRCPLNSGILKLIYKNCDNSDFTQLSVILENNVKIMITETEMLYFCDKFPNIKVFQFESFSLLIKEKTIGIMFRNWTQIEVLILNNFRSNSQNKKYIETYRRDFFTHLNPNIRVMKIPGLVLNDFAIRILADKPFLKLNDLRVFNLIQFKSMAKIGENIKLLSKLYLSLFVLSFTPIESNLFFKNIAKLQNLEKLHILIDSEISPIITWNEIKHLKNCNKLRSLGIESTDITTDCIEAIPTFLTQLSKLELTYVRFDTDSDQCIEPIERLNHLKSLKLSISPELKDQTLIKMMENCKHLSQIDVSRSEVITTESIVASIRIANTKPKQQIKCLFDCRLKQNFYQLNQKLPQNLKIQFY